jgi:hypothetical protein
MQGNSKTANVSAPMLSSQIVVCMDCTSLLLILSALAISLNRFLKGSNLRQAVIIPRYYSASMVDMAITSNCSLLDQMIGDPPMHMT